MINIKKFTILVFFVLLGIGGGVVGGLFSRQYFLDYYVMPQISDLDLSNNRGIVIRDAKKVVVEQNDLVNETAQAVGSSYAGIFKKKNGQAGATTTGKEKFSPDNYYNLKQPLGLGVIITSDGWMITGYMPATSSDFVVAAPDGKVFPIDKAVEISPLFKFIHIAANDLPTKKFADAGQTKNGQLIIAVNLNKSVWLSSIIDNAGDNRAIKSSDDFSGKIRPSGDVPKDFQGAAIFNLNGEYLGIIDSAGKIESIQNFSGIIRNLLENGRITRPYLGVNYLLLSDLAGNFDKMTIKKGAILTGVLGTKAVLSGSPAEKAGLKEGDIIMAIDDAEINSQNDLSAVIQGKLPGDKIVVKFWRQGDEKEIEIMLGEK